MSFKNLLDLRKKTHGQTQIIERVVIQKRSLKSDLFLAFSVVLVASAIIWGISKADEVVNVPEVVPAVENSIPDSAPVTPASIPDASITPDLSESPDVPDDKSTNEDASIEETATTTDTPTVIDPEKIDTAVATDTTTIDIATNTTTSADTTTGGVFAGVVDFGKQVKDVISNALDKVTDLITATTTSTSTQTDLVPQNPDEQIATIEVVEKDIDTGKLITVSSPDESTSTPLVNIVASTSIPEIYNVGEENKIQIKWRNPDCPAIEDSTQLTACLNDGSMAFLATDTDNNGKLDLVEWIIPHLSTQVFEIIFISKAFQLDAEQNIIADIYETVKTQDNNYATINSGQYVRVTFEKELTNKNDITLFARSTDYSLPTTNSIEVYPVYKDSEGNIIEGSKIATFENITDAKTYKILLKNLQIPTGVFDLKVVSTNSIDIDYIVDPTITWTGATSGDVSVATNYTGDALPIEGDIVTVASDATNMPGTGTAPSGVIWQFGEGTTNGAILDINDTTSVLPTNSGTITTNNGTVTTNSGTIITNNGTISHNDGTVTANTLLATVRNYDGTVGTNEYAGNVYISKTGGSVITTNSGNTYLALDASGAIDLYGLDMITETGGTITLTSLTDSIGGGSLDLTSNLTVPAIEGVEQIVNAPLISSAQGITITGDISNSTTDHAISVQNLAQISIAGNITSSGSGAGIYFEGDSPTVTSWVGNAVNNGTGHNVHFVGSGGVIASWVGDSTNNSVAGYGIYFAGGGEITSWEGDSTNTTSTYGMYIEGGEIGTWTGDSMNTSTGEGIFFRDGAVITNWIGSSDNILGGRGLNASCSSNPCSIVNWTGNLFNRAEGYGLYLYGLTITDWQGNSENSGSGYGVYLNGGTGGGITSWEGESTNTSTGYGIYNDGVIIDNISVSITNTGDGSGMYNSISTINNISGSVSNSGGGYGISNNDSDITLISGTTTNSGAGTGIYNWSGSTISNISGTTTNSGAGYGISNFSSTITDITGSVINEGTGKGIYNTSVFENLSGSLTNSGSGNGIENENSSIQNLSGSLTNSGSGNGIYNVGYSYIVNITGYLTNSGSGNGIYNELDATVIDITGTSTNSNISSGSVIYNRGVVLDISGVLINSGDGFSYGINNQTGANIINISGSLINDGAGSGIGNSSGATITDISGTITNSNSGSNAGIYNYGTITDLSGAIINSGSDNSAGISNYATIQDVSGTITNSSSGYVIGIYNQEGGTINNISGTINNAVGNGPGIYNNAQIDNISGTIINSGNGNSIYNSYLGTITDMTGVFINNGSGTAIFNDISSGVLSEISGTIYNFSGMTNSGLDNTYISALINIPVANGKIWTNASSTDLGNWDNPDNWLLGVTATTSDNIILRASINLTSDITNDIYFAKNEIVLNGNGFTVNGKVEGINGNDELNVNLATNGYNVDIMNATTTGNITAGAGGDAGTNNGGNGGDITITGTLLDFDGKTITGGIGGTGALGNGDNGSLYLVYQGLNTNASTLFNEIGFLIINGTTYSDTPAEEKQDCTNGVSVGDSGCVWNGTFNPIDFYYNNATGDGNWNNPDNWWNSADFTGPHPANPPAGYDRVYINGEILTGTNAQADTISFNGTSSNAISIVVTHNAIFNDSSLNTGTITSATSTFYEDLSSSVGGTIVGFLQRIFRQSATFTRDFTTEGNRNDWTIISTGVNTIVDLANATYDIATNIFKALLGGSFISNVGNVTEDFFFWTQVLSEPVNEDRNWIAVVSNAEGDKLAAVVYGGKIYTSSDGGSVWVTSTSSDVKNWVDITSNATGDKLATVVNDGRIYTSVDNGVTWATSTSSSVNGDKKWRSIASNNNGDRLAAVAYSGRIYTSSDSGVSWATSTSPEVNINKFWRSIASNAEGDRLIAVGSPSSRIYTSSDYGATWASSTSPAVNQDKNWADVASNAVGDRLVALANNGLVYMSSDYGVTWATSTSPTVSDIKNWYSITSNAVGDKLAGVVTSGLVYISSDYGVNWELSTSPSVNESKLWRSITSNADGDKLVAVASSDRVYIANAEPTDGVPVVPTVTINSPIAKSVGDTTKWVPNIDWGTAKICQYSYDAWTTTNTVNCSNDGSELPRPTAGEHTLHLRATDSHNGITEKSIEYVYDNTVPTYTMCGTDLLDEATRPYYYLTQDVTGPCTVTASSTTTTLKGNLSPSSAGYTVSGNIVGNGNNLNISNITITGTVDSDGGNISLTSGSVGGVIDSNGGDLTLSNSIVSATTTSSGGDITISNATTTDVVSTGSSAGSNGGFISVSNSNVGNLSSSGVSNGSGAGGNAGNIIVEDSTTGFMTLNGGDATGAGNGGDGGNATTTNSLGSPLTSTITANGGSALICGYGGSGGYINLIDSSYGTLTANEGSDETRIGGGYCAETPSGTSGSRRTPVSTGIHTSQIPSVSSTPTTNTNTNSGSHSFVPNTINQVVLPVNMLQPVKFDPLPTFGQDKKGSFSFVTLIENFLFASSNVSILDSLNKYPKLQKYITDTLGFNTDQKLVALYKKPLKLDANAGDILGIFKVISPKGSALVTTLKVDIKGNLSQNFKINPKDGYETLKISLATTSEEIISGKFNDVKYNFTNEKNSITTTINIPKKNGIYAFTTSASPLPLVIEVASQTSQSNQINTTSKPSLWSRIKSWFGR